MHLLPNAPRRKKAAASDVSSESEPESGPERFEFDSSDAETVVSAGEASAEGQQEQCEGKLSPGGWNVFCYTATPCSVIFFG